MTNALSPQVDVATDPRSFRNSGTFGEDPEMVAAMGAAYVEGLQTSYDDTGLPQGWGSDSVSTVIKHFPGDGMGEGGRDSHAASGQFAVTPGNNLPQLLGPFQAASEATGAMTSYSIVTDDRGDPGYGTELVGSAYNPAILSLLRDDLAWDGMVVTDWGVVVGGPTDPTTSWGTAWGVQDLTVPERIVKALAAGVDAFGGLNDAEGVLAAFDLWQQDYETGARAVPAQERWRESAERILIPMFLTGLFEDPFVDLTESLTTVGNAEFTAAGWQAQLDSVVVTKNDAAISCPDDSSVPPDAVYIPQSFDSGHSDGTNSSAYTDGPTIDLEVAQRYFSTVETDEVTRDAEGRVTSYLAPDLAEVDLVVVGMTSPNNGTNFSGAGYDRLTGTYYPLSLQYRPYVADGVQVRRESIAGTALTDGSRENRSYFGQTSRVSNESELAALQRAVDAVAASGRDIPVVVALAASNPVIPSEFESLADAVVVGFGVSDAALLELITGGQPARGRLPMTFPADMDTVEANFEDTPFDLEPYVDTAGNAWDYGFGLATCTD